MSSVENHLIELLPSADRTRLLKHCEPVELVLSTVLSKPDERTAAAYFPISGFISLIAQLDGKPALEVGMVGREGMLGAQLVLGVLNSPLHALVQGPGSAWRIESVAFRAELARSVPLQRGLQRYLFVLMAQLASAAACLRFHQITPRLARWLLMSHDRSFSDSFAVTQEFLAYMLGVRRVGITAAAGVLRDAGLIRYHRGSVSILNRQGLENAACTCYATDRATYAHLLN